MNTWIVKGGNGVKALFLSLQKQWTIISIQQIIAVKPHLNNDSKYVAKNANCLESYKPNQRYYIINE